MGSKLFETANSKLFILIFAYLAYLFIGASIFDSIESPNEARLVRELNEYVLKFRQQHSTCLTIDELNSFIKAISIASNKGISALRNVSSDQKWTFGQSIFFAGTVLTTIGYGNVSPLTAYGKFFCILFAVIGIPITLILLGSIIERLMFYTTRCLNYLINLSQPYINALFTHYYDGGQIRIAFALLCASLVLTFFMLIPAAIYAHIEGWSYLNAFYYCFISLTTVGLGDYVPGDKNVQDYRHLYKICSTAYLIIGILVMVWLLQIFSETPEFNLYQYFTLSKDGFLTSHPNPSLKNNSYHHNHHHHHDNYANNNNNNNDLNIDLRSSNNNTNNIINQSTPSVSSFILEDTNQHGRSMENLVEMTK